MYMYMYVHVHYNYGTCLIGSGGKRHVSLILVGLVVKHDVPIPVEGKLIQQYLRKNTEK